MHYIAFITPVVVAAVSYPFLGAPNRSLFSQAVEKTPELTGFEGTMQSLLSMASSLGGFTAPFLITHFCLRTPDEVDFSLDAREFTPFAVFSPLLSLAGLCAIYFAGDPKEKEDGFIEKSIDESTSLTQTSPRQKKLSALQEAKRASVRGSILCSMSLMPQTGEIFDDDDCEPI